MTDFVEQLKKMLDDKPMPGTRFWLVYPRKGIKAFDCDTSEQMVERLFDDSLRYFVNDIHLKTHSEMWNGGMYDIETYIVYLEECKDGQTNITPELMDAMKEILEYWK